MKLRSIPPANRQRGMLRRLSSMRAATSVGLTLIGAHRHGHQPNTNANTSPVHRIISPDEEYLALKAACTEAIAERLAFWKDELTHWAERYGDDAMSKLREMVGE